MFRRQEHTIAPDAYYPANLHELGFFINALGQIRMIEAPDRPFVFNATNSERHNEVRNEAFHACLREEVLSRLFRLGIRPLYLPLLTLTKIKPLIGPPQYPILTPLPSVLSAKKRVVVIVNGSLQDLGILAYRQLQRDLGLNGGSVINFTKEMIARSSEAYSKATSDAGPPTGPIFRDGVGVKDNRHAPGLVVMNTGQHLYSHKDNRCMTARSWFALPRASIAHDPIKIHPKANSVKGHRTPHEHVRSIFDQVLFRQTCVAAGAELYVIAIEDGANILMDLFKHNFKWYGAQVAAMAMIHTNLDNSEITHPDLKAFMHQRTRQWKYSDTSRDPLQCTDMPDDFVRNDKGKAPARDPKIIRWDEQLDNNYRSNQDRMHRLTLDPVSTSPRPDVNANSDWGSGSVPCPTFAGGKEPVGECIFTEPGVQRAILSFFEEVAQDPENYRNPTFTTSTYAPRPTADAPFTFDADATMPEMSDLQTAAPMLTPEQLELEESRARIVDMHIALQACPANVQELARGRTNLMERISKQEMAIKDLELRAASTASVGVGQTEELHENWTPKVDGPQVAFAGTTVDSELLKAAGLGETADEELMKLDEEEKAFL